MRGDRYATYAACALLTVVFFAGFAVAQQEPTPIHVTSAVPANSRYEIVQSTLAAKFTFRLDKQTGAVCQIVKSSAGGLVWDPMQVVGLPTAPASGVHYEIFISGLASKFIFLMNLDSGRTWQLTGHTNPITNEETEFWLPIS